MRLWTLHPCYLDSRGLVALWREALLAQAVLGGYTRGYTHHPQLCRFRDTPSPMAAIATYLHAVHSEANVRGYRFNATKILSERNAVHIVASRGQLDYEWKHLVEKLRARDPSWLEQFVTLPSPNHIRCSCLFPAPSQSGKSHGPTYQSTGRCAIKPRNADDFKRWVTIGN